MEMILAPTLLVPSQPFSHPFQSWVLMSLHLSFLLKMFFLILIYACSVGFDRNVYNTREIIIVP